MKIPILILLSVGLAVAQSAPLHKNISVVKPLLQRNVAKVRGFQNETGVKEASSTGFLSGKRICLDGVINTVETLFMHINGDSCTWFVIQFPLAPEDAELLEGRSPKDDELLLRMTIQQLSALNLTIASETRTPSGKTADLWPTLFRALLSSFQQHRDTFCSRHPRMFVFDLKLDGTATPPLLCSLAKKKE